MGSVTELFDTPSDTTSPSFLHQELQRNAHEGMMKIIRDANANGISSPIDLPTMGARPPVDLSNDQRDTMLSIMSGQRMAPTAPAPAPAASVSLPNSVPPLPAATAAAPTRATTDAALGAINSVLPTGPSIPRPLINEMRLQQEDIDALQRMQEEQDARIEDINQILGPLSPSGRVTPLAENGTMPDQDYFEQYLSNNDFDLNYNGGDFAVPDTGPADGSDYNFNIDDGTFDPSAASFLPASSARELTHKTTRPATTRSARPRRRRSREPTRKTYSPVELSADGWTSVQTETRRHACRWHGIYGRASPFFLIGNAFSI